MYISRAVQGQEAIGRVLSLRGLHEFERGKMKQGAPLSYDLQKNLECTKGKRKRCQVVLLLGPLDGDVAGWGSDLRLGVTENNKQCKGSRPLGV